MTSKPHIFTDSSTRRIALGVAFVLILLGIGFATYFLDDGAEDEPAEPTQASLEVSEGVNRGGYELVDSLTLSWGRGDGKVAMSSAEKRSTLDAVFLGRGSRVYVVDHPPGRVGARVQWWEEGTLRGNHWAPGGATLFTADGDGFAYVLAKGVEPSERVVVVDGRGEVTSTFTVPLRLNSGGIVRHGTTLYARTAYSELDPQDDSYMAKDVLVPVAIDGGQATDSQAQDAAIDAWTILEDGRQITKTASGTATEDNQIDASVFVRFANGPQVKVPVDAHVLGGAFREECTWLLLPPRRIDKRGTPGWPALYDAAGAVVRMGPDGTALSVIPVPMSRPMNPEDLGWTGRVSTDGDRLVIATGDEKRIEIRVFGRKDGDKR